MCCVGGMVEQTVREATGHEFEPSVHTFIIQAYFFKVKVQPVLNGPASTRPVLMTDFVQCHNKNRYGPASTRPVLMTAFVQCHNKNRFLALTLNVQCHIIKIGSLH